MRVVKQTTTEPVYPVKLERVKEHLSITFDDHDELLRDMIVGATEWAEEVCNRAIVSQDYKVYADKFPLTTMMLPLGYVTAVSSIEYKDEDGNTQTWGASNYEARLNTSYTPAVRPTVNSQWPDPGDYFEAVTVTLTAGWTPENVPYTVRQAIMMKIGSLYYTRVPGDEDPEMIEATAHNMLAAWRLPPW